MLDRLRRRVDRALFFGKVLRASRVVAPVRPARLAHFVGNARKTPLGPHLAIMFHAAAHPDKEAIVEYDEAGRVRRLTWGELDAAINRLANALIARGAGGGARVALMLPNCSEYLIAQQALARIGATAVQIGYRLKPGEIAYILENAEPAATIVAAAYLGPMREARAQSRQGGPLIAVGGGNGDLGDATEWDRALASASPDVPERTGKGGKGGKDGDAGDAGDGGGVIVYTSGTTGKPKGANRAWRQTGFESVADMILQVGIRADDRHLVVCPLYHSAAPAFVAIMMSLGATVVLMNHFEPEKALQLIERERITCSLMVPTMIVRLANLPRETVVKYDTSSLRWLMSAAAPLSTDAARRFMTQFGPVLWNFYGATETGLVTLAGPGDHVHRAGTIGKKLRGNQIRLLDDAGHEVAQGQVGELYARNSTMIKDYHRNEEATRSAQRDGFFSVGDMGRVDAEGYYYLESRKHDMVISGGVNIYPREIEDHLHTHPSILEAAVIGVPDPEWGETLRAFIVLRGAQPLSEHEVIEFCRAGLADYKRPRKVTFLAELPRNPTGKVLKRELREHP
ncbi:MAG: AMP-binding protein [Deltaproteobacteria bacterium]|nr:AMP-binding protein [Deltaproteobacteria bacterium]